MDNLTTENREHLDFHPPSYEEIIGPYGRNEIELPGFLKNLTPTLSEF